jgi:hypothetical protein
MILDTVKSINDVLIRLTDERWYEHTDAARLIRFCRSFDDTFPPLRFRFSSRCSAASGWR